MALSRAPVNPAMVGHFMRMDRMTAVPSEVSMARPTRSMCILHAMVPRGCENCMSPISRIRMYPSMARETSMGERCAAVGLLQAHVSIHLFLPAPAPCILCTSPLSVTTESTFPSRVLLRPGATTSAASASSSLLVLHANVPS
jgi:hypothetical protein